MLFTSEEEYLYGFKKELQEINKLSSKAEEYLKDQVSRLDELLESVTKETFWTTFPEILGIDSKLSAFMELINYDEFTIEDVIQLVEKDYLHYIKESCGYNLKSKPRHSLIFNVA